jgi:predicted DNA-binding transcriptional regulator AlpA
MPTSTKRRQPAAPAAFAKKTAAEAASKGSRPPKLIEANEQHLIENGLASDAVSERPRKHVHAPRGPPGIRLLDKAEVCAITNVTFPTLWAWMRAGTFPRSRIVGGKSMWVSTEIESWMAALPIRRLKGDEAA